MKKLRSGEVPPPPAQPPASVYTWHGLLSFSSGHRIKTNKTPFPPPYHHLISSAISSQTLTSPLLQALQQEAWDSSGGGLGNQRDRHELLQEVSLLVRPGSISRLTLKFKNFRVEWINPTGEKLKPNETFNYATLV